MDVLKTDVLKPSAIQWFDVFNEVAIDCLYISVFVFLKFQSSKPPGYSSPVLDLLGGSAPPPSGASQPPSFYWPQK